MNNSVNLKKTSYWGKVKEVYKYYPTVRHRYNFVFKSLKKYLFKSSFSFFDYGCGDGTLILKLKDRYKLLDENLGGCDKSLSACEITKDKTKLQKIFNDSYPNTNDKYDVITCMEVIEHTSEYKKVLQWIYDNLSPDGLLLLSTQTGKIHGSDKYTEHVQHFDKKYLEAVLSDIGFTVLYSSRWGFPFFSIQKKMTDYNFSKIKENFLEGEVSPLRKLFFNLTYYVYFIHDFINYGPQLFFVLKSHKRTNLLSKI